MYDAPMRERKKILSYVRLVKALISHTITEDVSSAFEGKVQQAARRHNTSTPRP